MSQEIFCFPAPESLNEKELYENLKKLKHYLSKLGKNIFYNEKWGSQLT